MWAIVPVKDMVVAKQRLSTFLDAKERQNLFHSMLTDVLTALHNSLCFDGIAIITRDQKAINLATQFNIRVIKENENTGQTLAVKHGISKLIAEGVKDLMQIPGDVPMVTPGEIQQVVAGHLTAPSMTIVPARDRKGSNCVVCSPPNSVPLQFGNNSFVPHLKTAQNLGITPTVITLPGLGLDIDTKADLLELLKLTSDTESLKYLIKSGIAKRFQTLQENVKPMLEENSR